MFLRGSGATRLAVVYYLLFGVALLVLPKGDVPETPFDESNTPTNEMVVEVASSSLDHRQSVTASVPMTFAQSRKIRIRGVSPVYAGQLTDSFRFQELFPSLRC